MQIRRANKEDATELSALRKSTIRNVNKDDYSMEQIKEWSSKGSAKQFRQMHDQRIRYVAIEDDKIVGFADVKKDNLHEMGSLYVHKDFLRKGIGTTLMQVVEDYVKKHGVEFFTLRASITAKPFYEKLGYKVTSLLKNHTKGDEYVMEKKL